MACQLPPLQGSTRARARRRLCRWTLMSARRSASAPSPQEVGCTFTINAAEAQCCMMPGCHTPGCCRSRDASLEQQAAVGRWREGTVEFLLHTGGLLGLRSLARAGHHTALVSGPRSTREHRQRPRSFVSAPCAGRFLNVPGPWCRDAPPPFWQEPRRPPGGGARARCGAACCGNATVRGDFHKVRCQQFRPPSTRRQHIGCRPDAAPVAAACCFCGRG